MYVVGYPARDCISGFFFFFNKKKVRGKIYTLLECKSWQRWICPLPLCPGTQRFCLLDIQKCLLNNKQVSEITLELWKDASLAQSGWDIKAHQGISFRKEERANSQPPVSGKEGLIDYSQQPRCGNKIPLTHEGKKKMWFIHTTEHSPALKKKEILPPAPTWMSLEDVMLKGKISQAQKGKFCMIPLNGVSKVVKLIETECRIVITRGWG